MQQRRGTAAQWISTNSGQGPVLNAGEIGFELDTNEFRIGDGVNHWIDLVPFKDSAAALAAIDAVIAAAPAALDTLNELAAAINDDPSFFTTMAANLSTHASETENIHGIANTADLATQDYVTDAIANSTGDYPLLAGDGLDWNPVDGAFDVNSEIARLESPTFTGTVSGITKSMVGLSNVDNTSDADKVISTATQDALDLKAPLASPTFTGTVSGITKSMVGLSQVDNTSDANKQISDATQDALDLKAPIDSPTFTGTVSGVTKAMVGLANAQNTSDADKPVSTATQTALDLKADIASPTFTGEVTVPDLIATGNVTVEGDFTVNGTNFAASATSITIEDNMLQLAHQNAANTVDLGLVVAYNDGTAKHSGLVRDVSDAKWKLFKGVTTEPSTVVDFTQGSLDDLAVAGLSASSATIGDVSNTELQYLNGVTASVQDQLDSKLGAVAASNTYAPIAAPTFTGIVSGITKSMVGLANVDNTTDLNKPVSTATQTALDLKANLASPTFTGTVVLPNNTITNAMMSDDSVDTAEIKNLAVTNAKLAGSIDWNKLSVSSTVSSAELGFLDGVTSAIQTQIDTKQPIVANVSSIEIGYLDGVTSGIQAQIDSKLSTATASSTYQPIISGVSDTEISYLNGVTSAIQAQIDTKAPSANPTFTGTVSGVTKAHVGLGNVDNTSDASKPVSTATQSALDLKAPLASPTFTGTVSGITKSMVGLGAVDNTSDANKPLSTAAQNALDLKAPLANPTFTGIVTLPLGTVTSGMILDGTIVAGDLADGAVTSGKILDGTIVNSDINATAAIDWTKLAISSTVSATELGYVDGVTSAIQTQLNAKAPLASPALTGVPTAPTAVAGTNTTQVATTEFVGTAVSALVDAAPGALNTLNELAAAIADDASFSTTITNSLATKAPIASPTFTGTVSGITKSMVGLANVDNTSDAAKPISTATQTALDAKLASATAASTYAPIASPTFTGTVSGVTKAHVGLGSVDNTSDAAKPVSTAQQTALDAKLALAGGTMTGAITLSGLPTLPLHAASKSYVDAAVEGLHVHASVIAATTANVNLATALENGDILDGVTLATGNRILVKNQTTQSENGIYVVQASGQPVRATDFDTAAEVDSGDFVFVTLGTVNANTGYVQTNRPAVIGTDPISFTQFSGAGTFLAGNGLTLTGNTFAVDTAVTQTRVANVSDTEIGYLDGVTSAIQTQLNTKLASATAATTYAPLASPTFTGTVTLPTGTVTSGMILDGTIVDADINASAAIAQSKISGLSTSLGLKADLASPALTGTPTAPTAVAGTNTTQVATTAFVKTAVDNVIAAAPGALDTLDELAAALGDDANYAATVTTALAAKAPLASPALTGTPTSPTATADTNTTQVATTAFVVGQAASTAPVMNGTAAVGTSLKYARQDHVHASDTTKANLASPTFTGTVTIPNGASLGTPTSVTLTNATGLPVATGISGLGSGAATFLATPSSANFASMITDEIGTGNIVLSEVATNAQTASYTLVAADRSKMVEMNVASANTVTVPPNSSVAYPVGTKIDILQVGAGQTTIAAGAGVTVNATPGLKIRAQWGSATLIKRATDTWVLVGDLSA